MKYVNALILHSKAVTLSVNSTEGRDCDDSCKVTHIGQSTIFIDLQLIYFIRAPIIGIVTESNGTPNGTSIVFLNTK